LSRSGSGREIVLGSTIVFGKISLSMLSADFGRADAAAGFVVLSAAMAVGAAFRYRRVVAAVG
jgi:hypothetical protein